jgi:DMSO/TMAO reductase YedYZ molybdopterin-dependent catalytic subunit
MLHPIGGDTAAKATFEDYLADRKKCPRVAFRAVALPVGRQTFRPPCCYHNDHCYRRDCELPVEMTSRSPQPLDSEKKQNRSPRANARPKPRPASRQSSISTCVLRDSVTQPKTFSVTFLRATRRLDQLRQAQKGNGWACTASPWAGMALPPKNPQG